MTHTEMDDLYELFVLGALEPELAAEIEQHLVDQCSYCVAHVSDATHLTAAMVGMAESAKPSAQLRDRVLAVAPKVALSQRRPARGWIFAVAGLSAACVALFVFSWREQIVSQQVSNRLDSSVTERNRLQSALENASSSERREITALTAERDRLRSALATANNAAAVQVAALTGERERLRAALANANSTERSGVAALTAERDQLRSALTNANTASNAELVALRRERDLLRAALAAANTQQRIQMAALEGERDQLESALAIIRKPDTRSIRFGTAASAHGWVFANRAGGLVLVGSQLPAVSTDRTLELWLVPKTGAPQPAGLFRPADANGNTISVSSLAVDPASIKAVAVSDEPLAGSSAPTTTPFLLVPLS